MTSAAVLLVVLSAFAHAGWNLLGKRNHPSGSFFLIANIVGSALLLPALVVFAKRLAGIPISLWWSLLATGFFQALYYSSLAAAYRRCDMSVAYPLARSVPVILTTLIVMVSQGAGSFGPLYLVGCLLVIAGILTLPASSAARAAGLTRACVLFACAAAIGTTGYSLVDSAALSTLRCSGFGALEAALFYLAAEAVASTVWMGGSVMLRRRERAALRLAFRSSWRQAAVMGLGIYAAYGIVLVAMSFAANVGYIVAFRQLSVPLGSVLAIVAFKEPAPASRLAGIAATSVGLLLVALG